MNKPTILSTTIVILLLAFGLRLYTMADLPLWTDEGWTTWFVETQNPIKTVIHLFEDRHPPLYFVALASWQNVAGNSHFALRLVAVFSSLISLAFVYRIAADWFSHQSAVYAVLFFAVFDIAVYYSVEVRHYSWLTMMAIITSALFLRYIKKPNRAIGTAYLLSVTGIMLTHYFGVFIMVIQAIFGTFIWQASFKQKRNLIGIWVGAFVLYIPWIVVIFSTLASITRGVGDFPGSFDSSYDDFLQMMSLLFDSQVALLLSMYVVGVVKAGKLGIYKAYIIASGSGLFLVMWLLNPYMGVLSPRMIYYLTPFLIILCAYGVAQLAPQIRAIIVIVFLVNALGTSQLIQARLNFAEMTQVLEQDYVDGNLIILETGWTDHATQYEIQQAIPESADTLFNTARVWQPEQIIDQAEMLLPEHDTVWVVQWLHAPIILPRLIDGWYGYEHVGSYEIPNTEPVSNPDPIRVERFQRPELDAPLLTFDNRITLHDVIYPTTIAQGMPLHLDFWWSVDAPLDRDYSLGVFMMSQNGQVVAQADGSITDTPSSQWLPESYEHALYTLQVSDDMPTGDYTVQVSIYYFETPDQPLLADTESLPLVGNVTIVP